MSSGNVSADQMPVSVSIEHFHRHGYCLVRGAMSREEILNWRKLAESSVVKEAKVAEAHSYHETIFAIHRLTDRYPEFSLLVQSPSLGAMAEKLLGGTVAIFLDQLICKPPRGTSTIPHQDAPFLPLGDQPTVNCWIALEDVDETNGALIYFDGFGRIPKLPLVHLDGNPTQLDVANYGLTGKTLPMNAGDCVFHDGLTVHGAHANASQQWRLAISIQYMLNGSWAFEPLHPFMVKLGINVGDKLTHSYFVRPFRS